MGQVKESKMKIEKLPIFFCILAIFAIVAYPMDAHADVFDKLAKLGGSLGSGLKRSGFMVAGLGLIAFSVAAIFGKVSWKTLAYIMMCTFILASMTAVVSYMGGKSIPQADFSAGGSTSSGTNTKANQVKR